MAIPFIRALPQVYVRKSVVTTKVVEACLFSDPSFHDMISLKKQALMSEEDFNTKWGQIDKLNNLKLRAECLLSALNEADDK